MYLKRIKIFGFKSFADEIIFDFSQGITAIVGPNGCGKSNVLDAFNWVLGEQSAGRLRGSEMQDMIFHGSRTRKPLGVASVELTLDNSRDLLPVDYDEVTVTRKLYRSGESEYLINKNPCRLKDIKELFLDTGIGRRAYSVMEQDNIKYILESNPVDRRGIIEEAAGIRKYKERRLEAERRLERIKTDLNEVKNILGEVQKNIRRLKRQTRRAKVYKDLKEKLRYLEISKLCQEYVVISEQLGGDLKKTGGLEEKILSLVTEKDKVDTKIIDLENQKNELDDKLLDSNREVYQSESRLEVINERIGNFESSLKQLDEESQRYSENLNYSKERLDQILKEIDSLQASQNTDKENEFEDLDKQYNEIKEKYDNIGNEIVSINELIGKNENDLFKNKHTEIELKNMGEVSEQRLVDLNTKKENLQQSSIQLKDSLGQKEEAIKNLEIELQEVEKEIIGLQKNLSKTNEDLDGSEASREVLLKEYHQAKAHFDAGKTYLPQLISIEELAHNKISGIEGPISSVIEKLLPEDEVNRLSELMGEKIGWVIAEDQESAKQAINHLKEKNLPPITFVLKDKVPYDAELYSKEDLPQDIERLIGHFTGGLDFESHMVWLSGCVLYGGGDNPPRVQKIMGMESEIEDMESQIGNIENDLNILKETKLSSQHGIQELLNKRHKLHKDLSVLSEEMGQLTGSHDYVSNELKVMTQEISMLKPREVIEEQLVEVINKIESLASSISENRELLKNKQQDYADITEHMVSVDVRRTSIKEILNREKESRENALRQKEQLEQDIERIIKLQQDIDFKREQISKQNENDKADVKGYDSKRKDFMKALGELEDQKGNLVKELRTLKENQKQVEMDLNKLKDTVGERKQTEERLKERVNSINVRLKEDLEIPLEDAIKDYREEAVDENEIFDLRDKLSRVGEVNLEAPKEFERENERFEFIKKHVDDLEEADADLRSIIRRINKQTKDKFVNTFETVNENFKEIFRKLFEGGKAQLRLLEPENVLESGIEIEARPEGKNVKSIIQFSGGESALCAIALMFAIYEVKPTPFCILDEVDSPLDDANLHRFLRMLKDHTDNTQFIIVTHNKQSMEMSDTFYGITMEEFGVSKTISVKLKDAKATA